MANDDLPDKRAVLVVARGQVGLLEALREFVAELGWINVIENRREGTSLLPRTDHVERSLVT